MKGGKIGQEALPSAEAKGGTSKLLILLLLVALAGACFYYFGLDFSTTEEPVAVSAPKPPAKMRMPERQLPAEKPDVVKEEVVPREQVAAVSPASPEPVVTAVSAPVKAPEPVKVAPAFALSSGSYLNRHELDKAVAAIEQAGYRVEVKTKPEPHQMTRLLVGRYATRELATRKMAELAPLTDGTFLAAEKGEYAVYAGSYLSLDQARRAADLLYAKGVRVEEGQVEIQLQRSSLRFGEFSSREQAGEVAARLKKQGVKDPEVVDLK